MIKPFEIDEVVWDVITASAHRDVAALRRLLAVDPKKRSSERYFYTTRHETRHLNATVVSGSSKALREIEKFRGKGKAPLENCNGPPKIQIFSGKRRRQLENQTFGRSETSRTSRKVPDFRGLPAIHLNFRLTIRIC